MWSSTRLPDTPMLFRIGKQHIYIELISYFYPCLCCNPYPEFSDSFLQSPYSII